MASDTVFWEPTAAESAEAARIVSRLREVRAERARLEAEEARLLKGALDVALTQMQRAKAPSDWDMPIRSMAAEIAAALREGPRTVEHRMTEATTLVAHFPTTLAALDEGRLSGRHAAVIAAEGVRIGDSGDRREYESRALGVAETTTVAGLRPMCRSIADAFEAMSLAQRHEAARTTRGVRVSARDDGMAELRLIAPAVLVQGIRERLTSMARSVISERDAFGRPIREADRADERGPGRGDAARGDAASAARSAADARRIDELRADLACDLLLAGAPQGHAVEDGNGGNLLDQVRGTVHVTIPAHVLTGRGESTALTDHPSHGNGIRPTGHGTSTDPTGRKGVDSTGQGVRTHATGHGEGIRATAQSESIDPTERAAAATRLTDAGNGSAGSDGPGRGPGHGHGESTGTPRRGRPDGVPTAGGEPIDPDTARRLAAEAAGWERLFLDPDTGALLTVDHYTPSAAQRRFLRARDEHCRFPGCRQGARRCDADHIVPHSTGGPTDVTNLQSLCRRHHMLKHHSPWRVRHLGGGELEWTSPLGYRYSGRPSLGVRFTATDAAIDPAASAADTSTATTTATTTAPPTTTATSVTATGTDTASVTGTAAASATDTATAVAEAGTDATTVTGTAAGIGTATAASAAATATTATAATTDPPGIWDARAPGASSAPF